MREPIDEKDQWRRKDNGMLKVFLVEDESIVREGLRDNIPWQQYGYQFTGEAADGEMALPLIRKIQPDVLITDIKMPFMDGLELSRIVSQEFPQMKIVIISGYDEFEYARSAIQIGVEQYLLKPVTKLTMQKVLREIREKIDSEREQKNYLEKFREEMHEYEQLSRHNFLERVFEGRLSVKEIYEEAQRLSLELDASCYNLIMVSMQEKKEQACGLLDRAQEELMHYFLRFPEYLVFKWNLHTYGCLIKCDAGDMEEQQSRALASIHRILETAGDDVEWYAAVGKPVERLSLLQECYSQVNHILSYRFLKPKEHILTGEVIAEFLPGQEEGALGGVDIAKADPEILKGFLQNGQKEELEDFVEGYLESQKKALRSKLFRDYVMLSVRFTTIAYVEQFGLSQEEFLEKVGKDRLQELSLGEEDLKPYMLGLLGAALAVREQENDSQGKRILKKALEYIEENYTQETISLNGAAGATGVSANYFSAIFSQEMNMTFTEYVTQKRMERAKSLMRSPDMHTGEIAQAVGYKDPHYFSFVFKKTQGQTPREYRMNCPLPRE